MAYEVAPIWQLSGEISAEGAQAQKHFIEQGNLQNLTCNNIFL